MASHDFSKVIKRWSEEDRPREKLIQRGKHSLTNSELLAILIGSGTRDRSAVQLARDLLEFSGHDLNLLSKLDHTQIADLKGIGKVKALGIEAAMELGRRRYSLNQKTQILIQSSQDTYNYCIPFLSDQLTEHFFVLLLRRNNTLIRSAFISNGGVSGTYVDPKVVFREAIAYMASAIVLVHNHPSGATNPSKEDIRLTQKLLNAGNYIDVQVLDHLIFTDTGYFSFSDEGLL